MKSADTILRRAKQGRGRQEETGERRGAFVAAVAVGVAAVAAPLAATAQHVHGAGDQPHGTPPSSTRYPPATSADLEAAFPDLGPIEPDMMLEEPFNTFVLLDQLEVRDADDGEIGSFELSAWAGRSLRRLWIRSEGQRRSGDTEHAELELLWGRAFAPWWDVVAGVRRDFEPGPGENWMAFGVQGLAPYRFELEATAYLGEGGRTAARVEAQHELLITNRLVLQPLLELNWYGDDDSSRGIGSGLASAEAGLRLRYEFRREIAPYVGLMREKKLGDTADLARAAGEDPSETRFVAGIRLWF
ncbi:MAG TPA: copper resistance protein B [Gammaproteobacteria bacterium]